jgi:hypothetical protein
MHGGPALGPNPKVHRQQSVRIANIALDYYNKRKKVSSIIIHLLWPYYHYWDGKSNCHDLYSFLMSSSSLSSWRSVLSFPWLLHFILTST